MHLTPHPNISPSYVIGHRNTDNPVVDTGEEYMQTRLYLSHSAARSAGRLVGMVAVEVHDDVVQERDELAAEVADLKAKLGVLQGLQQAVVDAKAAFS